MCKWSVGLGSGKRLGFITSTLVAKLTMLLSDTVEKLESIGSLESTGKSSAGSTWIKNLEEIYQGVSYKLIFTSSREKGLEERTTQPSLALRALDSIETTF